MKCIFSFAHDVELDGYLPTIVIQEPYKTPKEAHDAAKSFLEEYLRLKNATKDWPFQLGDRVCFDFNENESKVDVGTVVGYLIQSEVVLVQYEDGKVAEHLKSMLVKVC